MQVKILNGCNHRVSPGGFPEAIWIYSVGIPSMGAGPQKFALYPISHDSLRFIHLYDLQYGNCGINVIVAKL